jgi:cation:H+ antiporter
VDIIKLIIGLLVLIFGGDFLVKGAVALAVRMKVSMIVIGLTVVSFATSAPEMIVSVYAALSGHPDMAIGNVIGSNIANISLVLGLTAIIFPLSFKQRLYKFDVPVMLIVTALFIAFLYTDSSLVRWEGMIFIAFLIVFTVYLIARSRKEDKINESTTENQLSLIKLLSFLTLGSVCLYIGSRLLVDSASNLASALGVTDRVISVSIVAFGTSVPELAASIIAAYKKEKEMSLGNLIGSNIFNILAVLGVTSIIHPIHVVESGLLSNDIWWMAAVSLIILPLMFLFHKGHIGRIEGFILLSIYVCCMYLLF